MTKVLEGKVAWVTGAARGIGEAIAYCLAGQGADVVLSDIESEAVKKVATKLIDKFGIKSLAVSLDVTDGEGVENLVKKIVAELGGLHILVNNAGITRDNLLIRMSDTDWDQVLQVNLKGVFLCTRAAAKVMIRARFGKIINLTSIAGIMGNAGQVNYAASKAGVIGLTKSAAKELAQRGICVNAVAPGYIETDMTEKLPEKMKEELLKGIPLGKAGKPEDVAGVIAFLASPSSDYITGQILSVNGGMQM